MDYEAGWKSTLFNRHLRTQIGAFYMKYDNFQMDVINPASGQNGVVNLANSEIKGFEASFRPSSALCRSTAACPCRQQPFGLQPDQQMAVPAASNGFPSATAATRHAASTILAPA
jgi:iron complex outermembrane receptor protein